VLSIAAVAFLLGALIAWAAGLPAPHRGRTAERRLSALEAEVKALNAAKQASDEKALTKA